MANAEHLAILEQGVKNWNEWRGADLEIVPDLSGADLGNADLSGADLGSANLSGADLSSAILVGATLASSDLSGVDLQWADLTGARLTGADLSEASFLWANLSGADLWWANLSGAYLSEADLDGADLSEANLSEANLSGADISQARFFNTNLSGATFSKASSKSTTFANVDLSQTLGLDTTKHYGPSTIGIDTIYRSHGKIPEEFLRGCGVDENLIRAIPSLIGTVKPFQLYSCFISYNTEDEAFAWRLHSRLREAKARVWFAPVDIKSGEKIYDQIQRAIQMHERLLLVLSEQSLKSNWVETEIRKAIEVEKRENRRKLFPIRLTDYETLKKWRCFDADSGRDLAVEVREYFIPDFSNWEDHDSFEAAFEKLLRDLQLEEHQSSEFKDAEI